MMQAYPSGTQEYQVTRANKPTEMRFFDPQVVRELTENDWNGGRLKNADFSVVMFYMTWCRYCKQAKPDYQTFAQCFPSLNICAMNAQNCSTTIKAINIECDDSSIKSKINAMAGRNVIAGYPSILFFYNGKPIWVVPGNKDERTAQALRDACLALYPKYVGSTINSSCKKQE